MNRPSHSRIQTKNSGEGVRGKTLFAECMCVGRGGGGGVRGLHVRDSPPPLFDILSIQTLIGTLKNCNNEVNDD